MLPFYYVRTLEKLEIAFLDVVNDLHVNKYTDITRTKYTKSVPVPVFTYSSKNFANHWRNRESKKIPMPIPCAGLRFAGIKPNISAQTQTSYTRSIYSSKSLKWIQDLQPTPYTVTYDLELLADNRSDWAQLLENILPYFPPAPPRVLRIKEFDFYPEIENEIPLFLEGVNTTFEDEIELGSAHPFIRTNLSFRMDIDMYRPLEIATMIKYAELNMNIGEFIHKQQLFVYPTLVGADTKKDWEQLTPSTRQGYSLLKTCAGTLAKHITIDGATTTVELTVPDAIRPIKIPNFKELSLAFDSGTPDEIDNSGFGRDFIALNPSTLIFDADSIIADEGWKSSDLNHWNNILDWFCDINGNITAPYSFDISLQFINNSYDTIFQCLTNKETENFNNTGKTLPINSVYFSWGITDNRLFFNYHTTKFDPDTKSFINGNTKMFYSDELTLDSSSIYRFTFVLFDQGDQGTFGVSENGNHTVPYIGHIGEI